MDSDLPKLGDAVDGRRLPHTLFEPRDQRLDLRRGLRTRSPSVECNNYTPGVPYFNTGRSMADEKAGTTTTVLGVSCGIFVGCAKLLLWKMAATPPPTTAPAAKTTTWCNGIR